MRRRETGSASIWLPRCPACQCEHRMRTLSRSRPLRLTTFALLYFSQGVPWGFLTVSYALFLSDAGLDSLTVGAAIGVAHIPWTLKVVWGPLTDRFKSRRTYRKLPPAAEVVVAPTRQRLTPCRPLCRALSAKSSSTVPDISFNRSDRTS